MGNIINIEVAEAKKLLDSGEAIIFDVRTVEQYNKETVKGAQSQPYDGENPLNIPADKKVILHCNKGGRSGRASKKTAEAIDGNIYNLTGGITAWKDAGYAVEAGDA